MRFSVFLFASLALLVSSASASYLRISAGKGVYPLRLKAGVIDLDYRFQTHPEPTADGIEDYRVTIAIQDAGGSYLFRETPGSVTGWFHGSFSNPTDQTVYIWAKGGFILVPSSGGGLYRALDEGTDFSGDAILDNPVQGATSRSPSGPSNPELPPVVKPSRSEVHALIISGHSDLSRVLHGPVVVVGGIIGLGRQRETPGDWDPTVHVAPDEALLTGKKIPPVTPNLIDVRIARFGMSARFQNVQSNDN